MEQQVSTPVEGEPVIGPSSTDHPLYDNVVEACRTVHDPEIPVNIYDLGLVYRVAISEENHVEVDMTLTAPGCPVAGEMPLQVQAAVETVEGVREARVDLVFDPPWDPSRMSEDARLALDMF